MKAMTKIFVTIIIGLIVLTIVGTWTAVQTRDLLYKTNSTLPTVPIKNNEFSGLEQTYSGATTTFFNAWKDTLPANEDFCFQPVDNFGDFFKYYEINMVLYSEDSSGKTVYFRVTDDDDNRVASNGFQTDKDLCFIEYSGSLKSANKIDFSSLTIAKDIRFAAEDKFLVKIPDANYENEFETEALDFPMMFFDKTSKCFVVGISEQELEQVVRAENIPMCSPPSLESVSNSVHNDLETCMVNSQTNCGCSVNIPYYPGLTIEIDNSPGKSVINYVHGADSLVKEYGFMFAMQNGLTGLVRTGDEGQGLGGLPVPEYSSRFIPLKVGITSNIVVGDFGVDVLFDNKQEIKNRKIYLVKKSNSNKQEFYLGENKFVPTANYLSIVNDLDNVPTLCKAEK